MAKVVKGVVSVIGAVASVLAVIPSPIQPIAAVVATVASVASTALNMIAPTKPKSSAQGQQTSFKLDPQSGIPYVIGRTLTGGNGVHRDTWGTDNQYQGFAIVWSGGGPVQAIEAFQADQTTIGFGAGYNAVGGFKDFMGLSTQLGACPSPALPTPVAGFPGWGAQSKLSGYAAGVWVTKFDKKGKKYSGGLPRPAAIIQGVKVYDPRQDSTYPGGVGPCRPLQEETYVYSENPWLHALTWALGRWQNGVKVMGVGMLLEQIAVASFVDAANIADANNWKAGGVVSSVDDKWEVMKMLAQAGGGQCIRLGARLTALAEAPRVAVATIRESDLVGKASISATQFQRSRINRLVPIYRSEAHGWEQVPADPVSFAVHEAEDGGRRTAETEFVLVQQIKQAAELAGYEIKNSREFGPIDLELKIQWLGIEPGDLVNLDMPSAGLANQPALALTRGIDPGTGNVALSLRSETPTKHAEALGKTTTIAPSPSLVPPDLSIVAAPTVGSWTLAAGIVEGPDGTGLPILVARGATDNPNASHVVFEYRPVVAPQGAMPPAPAIGDIAADSTGAEFVYEAGGWARRWLMQSTQDAGVTLQEFGAVTPQTSYQIAVSYVSRGVLGDRRVLGPVLTGSLVASGFAGAGDLAGVDYVRFGDGTIRTGGGGTATDAGYQTALGTSAAIAGQGPGATAPGSAVLNSYVGPGQNLIPNSDQTLGRMFAQRWNPEVFNLAFGPNPALVTPGFQGWSANDYVLAGDVRSICVAQSGRVFPLTYGHGWVEFDLIGPTGDGSSFRTPCVPGETMIASAYFATHRCLGKIVLVWNDLAGELLSYSTAEMLGATGNLTNRLDGGRFERLFVKAVAPPGAYSASIIVSKGNTFAGETSSYWWLAGPMLERAAADQQGPSPYMPGPANNTRQLGYLGDLNADVTASNISAGFFGQGSLASQSGLAYGGPYLSGFGGLAGRSTVLAGTHLRNAADTVWLGDADIITSGGVAAGYAGQTAWGTYTAYAPSDIAPRVASGLNGNGDLARNITASRRDASSLLGRSGGGVYIGHLSADVTASNIAAGISGQTSWATWTGRSTADVNSRLSFLQSDGTMRLGVGNGILSEAADYWLTNGNVVTALGTSAAIAGQGPGATAPGSAVLNSYIGPGQNLVPSSDQLNKAIFLQRWNPDAMNLDWGAIPVLVTPGFQGWSTNDYVLAGDVRSVAVHQAGRVAAPTYGFTEFDVDRGDGNRWRIPCVAGEVMIASAYFQTHRCIGRISLTFEDSSGGIIDYAAADMTGHTNAGANALANFVRLFVKRTAPAGTFSASIIVAKGNTLPGEGDSYWWCAGPMLERAAADQQGPSPYMPGPANNTRQLGYTGHLNADVTASNIAAGYAGQGPWGTYSAIAPSVIAGRTARLDDSAGRALDGRLLNSNNNFGLRALSAPPGMSATAQTSTATVDFNSSGILYPDWGGTLSLPSASFPGLSQSTQYYFWRNMLSPDGTGSSYGYSTNLVDALGTGKVYLGRYFTPAAGGGGGVGGGWGGEYCVAADAIVRLADGRLVDAAEVKAGDRITVLASSFDGIAEHVVSANLLADADCVRLVTESMIPLTLALNTPMTTKDRGWIIAANASGYEIPVLDAAGFRWEKVLDVEYVGRRPVARIECENGTYAAGDIGGRFILSHNPIYKP